MSERKEFTVEKNTDRLDIYISEYLALFSRNQIRKRELKAFKKMGNIMLELKLSKPVFVGDNILIEFSEEKIHLTSVLPINLSIEIIYEDNNIIVLNKPQGIVTHPGISNYDNTVVNFLLHHIDGLGEIFNSELIRPGIVHRLDKDTSGILIVAKNLSSLNFLTKQFKNKTVNKVYISIIKGELKNNFGIIETFIDRDQKDRKRFMTFKDKGRSACTEYKVLLNFKKYSLVALKPKTGRTHQLRVHMKYANTPILGDSIYSRIDLKFKDASLMLHAYKLEIDTEDNDNCRQKFISKFPERFAEFLQNFLEKDDLNKKIKDITNFLDSF